MDIIGTVANWKTLRRFFGICTGQPDSQPVLCICFIGVPVKKEFRTYGSVGDHNTIQIWNMGGCNEFDDLRDNRFIAMGRLYVNGFSFGDGDTRGIICTILSNKTLAFDSGCDLDHT